MAVTFSEAPQRVLHIAQSLIDQYHDGLIEANVAFVIRDGDPPESNGKTTLGQASRFPKKLQPLVDQEYHFLIWLSAKVLEQSDEIVTSIIDHELCHCNYSLGEARMRHHDIEEFNVIIQRYGLYRAELYYTMNAFKQTQLFNAQISTDRQGSVGTVKTKQIEIKHFGIKE